MKLYLVINPAGYADPEEVRGVFSTRDLALKACQSGDRIDEIELDRVYPDGTDPERIEMRNKPSDGSSKMTPEQEAVIKHIAEDSPWGSIVG